MHTFKTKFGISWISILMSASLLVVAASSGAQVKPSAEKAGGSEKMEQGGKADKSAAQGKSENQAATQLSGDKEVPAVETKASGKSTIKVDENKSVTGKVTVENMTATAAHIHQGAPDKAGPVVIPLEKTADNTFSVPANTKLTDEQFSTFKAGNLYINVHSSKFPGGEVRAQLKP